MRALLLVTASVVSASLALAGGAAADGDHPAPVVKANAPIGTGLNAGGEGATWKLLTTFPTGNPHTDLDFFTWGGDTYASVGTLAAGPNAGGQTIVQLTRAGRIEPRLVAGHPSASCVSGTSSVTGLQHDVEATPKTQAQLLLDATDANGRCHDQGTLGVSGAPRGGLELVDVTNVADPVEIGLTSHVGEAHTVNVDPRRPHIAYAVTSDAVGVSGGTRQNEVPGSADRNDLDGFEVVDLSSCLSFPLGTSVDLKRMLCRPQVYRYRYPTLEMALGHSFKSTIYGCHELEVYADDRLTCGSGGALLVFDMSGAFDDNGTPGDYTDDKPRGTPLDCAVRPSSSTGPYVTSALVTDCTRKPDGTSLDVPTWLASGAPSLEGVEHLGSVHHQGRGGPFPSTEDNDFDHEAELSASGRLVLATDERGGGVAPPGATCSVGVDNAVGNGGIHAYSIDRLATGAPTTPEAAWDAYARTPAGAKAIFRVPVRTKVEPSLCTAHVFHQIPGQNRIFMGWYSQGTQVVDFVENADGTVEFRNAGWFIPENANTWTSAIFKTRENADGTFTYWGATGDFFLGSAGRSAIDVYEVTLPAPPTPAGG
jgi:hypothetical protein